MYIFTFHIVKITQRVPFFYKISMITNVILILYNRSINNKLILRDLHFRERENMEYTAILSVFSPFRRQIIIIPNKHSEVLSLSDSFLNDSIV